MKHFIKIREGLTDYVCENYKNLSADLLQQLDYVPHGTKTKTILFIKIHQLSSAVHMRL